MMPAGWHRSPTDHQPDDPDDERAQARRHEVGQGAADQDGRAPHGQRAEAVDDPLVQVGAEPDRGAHGRSHQVQCQHPGSR